MQKSFILFLIFVVVLVVTVLTGNAEPIASDNTIITEENNPNNLLVAENK